MNKIDNSVTKSSYEEAFRKEVNAYGKMLYGITFLLMLAFWVQVPVVSFAQTSDAPFLESGSLLVMEAESVPRNNNWQFENTEEGFGGNGYLRYVGENHFSEPGNDILEFNFVITNPGSYFLFNFVSHLGAPAPDQENDVWTRLNDGEWIKTVHGGDFIDEGFSYHTTWTTFNDQGEEIFLEPKYELEAGLHTFQISSRSFNVRVDRIHIFDGDNFNYFEAQNNQLPESDRSGNILTVNPSPVAFSGTQVGLSTSTTVDIENGGDETITISDISISGQDASQFDSNFSGSLQVGANGSSPLTLTFEPTSSGSKTAQATITHSGVNSPTIITLFGSASSGGSGSTVLYRVNAGGPEIADALADWEEDQVVSAGNAVNFAQTGTPNSNVNAQATGDWSWGEDNVITLDASVPPNTPTDMFKVGRWDPPANPQMQWDIPVEAGKEIEVRLYFAEIRFSSSEDPDGPRVFSVLVDNFVFNGFSDINLFEEYGYNVGAMKSTVIESDGNVDIDLINATNDPIIMGIEIVELGSLSRNMDAGWNLVGIPSNPANSEYTSVFDNVTLTGAPYEYTGGAYQQVTNVEAGKGYWVNTTADGNQSFDDDTVESLTLNLIEGWNMISGPGCFVAIDAISDPSNILIDGTLFSYDGGYQLASGLLPGFGYWVQTSGAGSITLDCGSAGKGNMTNSQSNATSQFGKLIIEDAGKGHQTLLFGASLDNDDSFARFMMPPKAPQGRFDVRFSNSGRLVEGNEGIVWVQSDAFPLSVAFEEAPQYGASEIVIEEIINGVAGRSYSVAEGETIEITNSDVTSLRIATGDDGEEYGLPAQFALTGNYPNPFNPSTQVTFDLPEAGVVQVEVFDMLGRHVLSVPAQEMSAGANRQVQIDANDLASGMYFYNVRVQMGERTEISTGRMTLLK